MKIICWYCRGLGSPRAVQALLRLIRLENPNLVFLMGTRLRMEEWFLIKVKFGFECCQLVDYAGEGRRRAGGLILLWRESVKLDILSFLSNHIGGVVPQNLPSPF